MNNPVKRSKFLAKLKKEWPKYYFYKEPTCLNKNMRNVSSLALEMDFIVPTNLARRGEWLSLSQMKSNLNAINKSGTMREGMY